MISLKNFLKGVVCGIGGIAPGLSGSVLLVILGLYEDTVQAIGTLFGNLRQNLRFLLPICGGLICGVLLFSRLINFLLQNYEFATRYVFLGLILGTVPLFFRQATKHGYARRHWLLTLMALLGGFWLFGLNGGLFPTLTEATLWQAVLLGVVVAGSSVIPGVDSAAILSALGLYELYVASLASVDLPVLLPAALGLAVGAYLFSAVMNQLLHKAYTPTFAVIFGLFLSVIPSVLNDSCEISSMNGGATALLLALAGFVISAYLGDVDGNNRRIKEFWRRRKI